MSFDRTREYVLLFGGEKTDGTPFGDTWVWDGKRWNGVPGDGPPARTGHAMAYNPSQNLTILFGGYSNRHEGDTWAFDGHQWRRLTTHGPSARTGHAMAYSPQSETVYLYGGTSQDNWTVLGDLWEWNGERWRQLSLSGLSSRTGHAMTYDPVRARMLLFGGMRGNSRLGDLWACGHPCPQD